ncbi:MAG: hypothetical protein K6T91_04655 [Firmicutes bacterium]|nr:hypothetical protein [Bacillota bacterium]
MEFVNRPSLHVQNIFDVFNPFVFGVNGYLKMKCVQVQNRVVSMANPGDIVAVGDDCPQAFIDYMLSIRKIGRAIILRYSVKRDERKYLNAYSVFKVLPSNPIWGSVIQRNPILNPYIKSHAIYKAANEAGMKIPERTWRAEVEAQVSQKMNDKANLYRECEKLSLPIPLYLIANGESLAETALDLLSREDRPIYIRQARSGGAFGNITAERFKNKYIIHEAGPHLLTKREFIESIRQYVKENIWREFVVTELLDLYASPGTLFYVSDTEVKIIAHTYQLLNQRRRFLGFMYPITDANIARHINWVEQALYALVEPWRRLGYRGFGNVDWMVTKDGHYYIAELNARQTAVVPCLKIENAVAERGIGLDEVLEPNLSVFTIDRLYFKRPISFAEAYSVLSKSDLLWGQGKSEAGIVITIPPAPAFGINSIGLMALGPDLLSAYKVYKRAIWVLGSKEGKLLFEPQI